MKNSSTSVQIAQSIQSILTIYHKLIHFFSFFGTNRLNLLLLLSFNITLPNLPSFAIFQSFFHPLSFSISKISYDSSIPSYSFDKYIIQFQDSPLSSTKSTNIIFFQKIFGITMLIHDLKNKKTITINGFLDDIPLECISNEFIENRKNDICQYADTLPEAQKTILKNMISILNLKNILLLTNSELLTTVHAIEEYAMTVKTMNIDLFIQQFLQLDLFSQREKIIHLLIYSNDDSQIHYVCHLLYELVTIHLIDNCFSNYSFFEYFPFTIQLSLKNIFKTSFKDHMHLSNKVVDTKVSIEQQIISLNVSDSIKRVAFLKLTDLNNKSDEMSTKAKHYFDGFFKIPFSIYKEEPFLKKVKECNQSFFKLISQIENMPFDMPVFIKKEKYTIAEINKYIRMIKKNIYLYVFDFIKKNIHTIDTKVLSQLCKSINSFLSSINETQLKGNTKSKYVNEILLFLEKHTDNYELSIEIFSAINDKECFLVQRVIGDILSLDEDTRSVDTVMNTIHNTLDASIYGHTNAKNQIIKIIAQWMNGEQSGYCFGFEGSPGIGKTSLAKNGISKCLQDINNTSRPFAFIALGGSSNGSLLEGHSFTYMNSTWGRIVDILMDAKCMNPIIYIDELDKVSKTENGREIIGILTHLIDSTQNSLFQDKYFNNIPLDLSKALFIFSYNDASQVDSILLDRIHRIKFDNLSVNDKMVIMKQFILPEFNSKMGFESVVELDDSVIRYLIETYTDEPGVRKLKEIVFDLYGEINIELLKKNDTIELPIQLTKDMIHDKYLKRYDKIIAKYIHVQPEVGIINGLFANSLGKGGIVPIQTMFYPCTTFLELKLTGLQGNVMKESMNVAKTLAWNVLNIEEKKRMIEDFESTRSQGLHIHCPEGAVSKDGPSAGTAITLAIYSLFTKRKLLNDIAITGEINLSGDITMIGGLDMKIYGGIHAGIRRFFYPSSNEKDFQDWIDKDDNREKYSHIKFYSVTNIKDFFDDSGKFESIFV